MATQVKSVGDLAAMVAQDATLEAELKSNPAAVLARFATVGPLENDVWIYRVVVGSLGAVVLVACLGAIVIILRGAIVPDVLTALGSAVVGALAGLLAPAPNRG